MIKNFRLTLLVWSVHLLRHSDTFHCTAMNRQMALIVQYFYYPIFLTIEGVNFAFVHEHATVVMGAEGEPASMSSGRQQTIQNMWLRAQWAGH